jgi:signal transduction histidine kinase/DNA-binding response OmpR family regulator
MIARSEGAPGLLLIAMVGVTAAIGGLLAYDQVKPGDSSGLHQLTAAGVAAAAVLAVLSYTIARRRGRASPAQAAELQRARQSAENASQARGRYLASVGHELRAPLNAIYGYAQLIEHEGIGAREAAGVIRRCAEHLNGMIEGLLDISQIESGVLRLKRDVVALAPFLDQIASMHSQSAAAKGLRFEYRAQGPLPLFVRMDQNRLRQVLINLLSNAIKFTDEGSVTLVVSHRAEMGRFVISDTGPGIDPADQERIFDPFERGRDRAQADRPGVGLGLPIAKAIVEMLGGRLDLRSAPGEGTTFEVTMMLPHVAGKLEHGPAVRRIAGYLGPRRTILVVEDDPEQLAFLRRLLDALGFEVAAFTDGKTALAEFGDDAPDLAILDIAMPIIGGWETAALLRERFGQDVRILMLSGNTHESHRPDFANPVHDLFVAKPVEFEPLIEAIGGLLELAWVWDQADAEMAPAELPREGRPQLNEAALQHIGRLREFLRIGYLRGLEQEIAHLVTADPNARGLADELIDGLDRFDLADMAARLERA